MNPQSTSTPGSLLHELLARPARGVLVLAALQCLAWTLAPALSHSAPPLDVVESYLWGKEWVIGTSKHPNLPGWMLEISRHLTGAVGWPAYLVSQLFVAATYLLAYRLGSEMMDPPRALAGCLLLTGVFYFAWPAIEFNHNVAQMPFWAAIALCLWRLRRGATYGGWLVLGLLAGVSLYAKLSSGLLLAIGGTWILADAPLRRQLARPAPWLGLLAFLLTTAPLLGWLVGSRFRPLVYAAERSSASGEGPLQFLAAQVLACLGLVGLAALSGLLGSRTPAERPATALPSRQVIVFLTAMTAGPVLAAAAIAAVTGAGLKSMWGSPMLGLSGLLMVAITSQRFNAAALRRLALAAVALLLVVPAGYALDTVLEARITGHPKRQNWPQAVIATRFDALWREKTGQPLRVVAGERWVAGIVALRGGAMPSILTDGDLALSPWITPDRLRREGALVTWEMRAGSAGPPPNLAPLIGGHETGVEHFAWPLFPNAEPLAIGYAIVPPA